MATEVEREMSPIHAAALYQSLGLPEHEPLPPKLEKAYWELKRIFDRTGTIIRTADLALMAWQLGYGKPTAKELAPPTVVDLWRKRQLKAQEIVSVKWRDKWVDAKLISVTANDEVIAQVVGEADEYRFEVDDVKLAAA